MAGLLRGHVTGTMRRWAGEPCAPHPCGEEVWRYACEAAGVPVTALPQHRTLRAVSALLRRENGLVAYAGRLVERIGWRRLSDLTPPQEGDVGVVMFAAAPMKWGPPTCAICLGATWAAKGDGFVKIEAAEPIAAWRFE